MSRIRGKNTKPEMALRAALWAAGVRGYRLHTNLPGRPDLFFPRDRIAVFVDGCFWHGCPACNFKPATNRSFWKRKIAENRRRDRNNARKLVEGGIRTIRVREHALKKNPDACLKRILSILQR